MQKLLDYLKDFFERTEPLQDLERIFSKVSFKTHYDSFLYPLSFTFTAEMIYSPCILCVVLFHMKLKNRSNIYFELCYLYALNLSLLFYLFHV